MFRTLALLYADPNMTKLPQPETVFATHPLQLSRWLEQVFAEGGISKVPLLPSGTAVPLGDQEVVTRLRPPLTLLDDLTSGLQPTSPGAIPGYTKVPAALGTTAALPWDHLIYAYLVESTGVVDVLGEVVRRFMVGETLEAPRVETLEWARATEELFFREPPQFHILGATSMLRPRARDNRWNAYYRMFGCTPPQARPDDAAAWKRDVGAGANLRFIELWHELLRQVWMGIQNARNAVGANPTDPSYLAYLCQTIGELLRLRRRGGMLAREEFAYVCMLSWFHLTLESDTSVVIDLRAQANALGNPADRLAAIAARVGMRAAPQSRELFELADRMSVFLWALELDVFTDQTNAQLLFAQPVGGNKIADDMIRIIDLWQSATGERLKDTSVAVAGPTVRHGLPVAPQPTRLPAGSVPPRPAGALAAHNGHAPVPRA
jgi:hypothetical protein